MKHLETVGGSKGAEGASVEGSVGNRDRMKLQDALCK